MGKQYITGYKGISFADKEARQKVKAVEENQIELIEDELSMEGISDITYDTLQTTNKTLIGGVNEVNSQLKEIANETTLGIAEDGLLYIYINGEKVGNGISISNAVEVGGAFYSGRWYAKDDGTMFTNTTGSEIYAIVKNATKLTLTKADSLTSKVAVSINDGEYTEYSFATSLDINIPQTDATTVKVVFCDITTTANQYTNPQTVFMRGVTTDGIFLYTKDIENKKIIAFFGDSITRGNSLDKSNVTNASKSYPHLVNKYLGYRPLQVGFGLTGVAIEQTANEGQMPKGITILQNIAKGYPATYESDKVKYVFVNYGTNDYSTNFESAYDEYIKKIKEIFPNSVIVCMQLMTIAEKIAIQTVATNNDCKYYKYDGATLSGIVHPNVDDSELIANNILYYISNTLSDIENQVKLTSLTSDKTLLKINKGETNKITISYIPTNTTQRELIFESSNKTIATVNGNGYVNAITDGNCNIICKSRYNKSINITIPVTVIDQTIDTTGIEHNMTYEKMSSLIGQGMSNSAIYIGSDYTIGKVKSVRVNCKSEGQIGYIYICSIDKDISASGNYNLTIKKVITFTSTTGINTISINYENTDGEKIYVGIANGSAQWAYGKNANDYKNYQYTGSIPNGTSLSDGDISTINFSDSLNSQWAIAMTYYSDK